MGTIDDYNYQKRVAKSAKKAASTPTPKSSAYTAPAEQHQSTGSAPGVAQQEYLAWLQVQAQKASEAAAREAATREAAAREAAASEAEADARTRVPNYGAPAALGVLKTMQEQNPAAADVAWKQMASQTGQSIDDKLADDRHKLEEERRKVQREALTAALKERRKGREQDTGEGRELTIKEYKALDKDSRAAVDFNTLLASAVSKDLALDKNKDGVVTMAEAGNATEDRKGYGKRYDEVFGAAEEGETRSFAPHVVGLLSKLGVQDNVADADFYTQGNGFVDDSDLKAKRHINGLEPTGPNGYTDSRGNYAAIITDKMRDFKKVLAESRVVIDGMKAKVSIRGASEDQRGQFVDNLATGTNSEEMNIALRMSGNDPRGRISEDGGIDASILARPGDRQKAGTMSNLFQMLSTGTLADGSLGTPVSLDRMMDEGWITDALKKTGLDYDSWSEYVKDKKKAPAKASVADELMGAQR